MDGVLLETWAGEGLHVCWFLGALWTTANRARSRNIEGGSLVWQQPVCVSDGIMINTIGAGLSR